MTRRLRRTAARPLVAGARIRLQFAQDGQITATQREAWSVYEAKEGAASPKG